jgi:hypothetical protein
MVVKLMRNQGSFGPRQWLEDRKRLEVMPLLSVVTRAEPGQCKELTGVHVGGLAL